MYVHRGLREHRPRSFRKRLAWGLGAFPLRIEIWSRRLAPSWGCGTGHVQESSCCMLLLVKAPSSSCFWRGLWGQEAIPTDARCLEAGYCERRRIGLRPPASSSSVVAKNIYTGSPHFERFRFFPRPRTKWSSHNVKKIWLEGPIISMWNPNLAQSVKRTKWDRTKWGLPVLEKLRIYDHKKRFFKKRQEGI